MTSTQSAMELDARLRAQAPGSLANARALAHRAAQLLTTAARANLAAADDDSHSNLGWEGESGQFRSQPLNQNGTGYFVCLSLTPLRLSVANGAGEMGGLDLGGLAYGDAEDWFDQQLAKAGFKPASSVELPYELPNEVAGVNEFNVDAEAGALEVLAAWFGLAQDLLSSFAAEKSDLHPGPSPVRCWPHHFDIATYVGLETGDFESARGIGVGMSPGDESYGQPYFYINPWPHLDAGDLPDLSAPGHWHTSGFVGAIATAEEVLSLDNIDSKLAMFISGAFAAGREKLGV